MENAKNYMYIDESYPVNQDLPQHLLSYIKELEEYYENDDWIGFDCLLESLEGTIKQYKLCGKITEKDLDNLFKRYGIR